MFESTFPKKWAEEIISRMQRYYRSKFDAAYPIAKDQTAEEYEADLIDTACEVFEGLTADDIKRGLARMKRSTFCPVFPEFRSWCEPESEDWLGSHEAWAISEKSIGFNGEELTVVWTEQMAQAFSRCDDLVKTGDKYQRAEAKKIFCDAYDRLVTQAKDKGLKPIYTTSLGTDRDQQITAIQQATVDGFLTQPDASALLEHKQTKQEQLSEAKRYQTTAQEAIARIKEQLKIKPINKMTEEVKEVQPWEPAEVEHVDPFDNFDEYKQLLKIDGKPLPYALAHMERSKGEVA